MRSVTLLAVLVLLLGACKPTQAEPLDAEVTVSPWPPQVRRSEITIRVPESLALTSVEVVGDMTHAGMIPVEAKAVPQGGGVWKVDDFDLNMRGDWILTVTARDKEGKKYVKEVRFTIR
jgi:hypothetical protein